MPIQLPLWRQLRWNLIVYFVILAALPVTVVQYITLTQTSEQAKRQILNQLQSVSGLKANQLQQWVGDSQQVLLTFLDPSSTGPFIDLIAAPTDAKQTAISSNLSGAVNKTSDTSQVSNKLFDKFFIYNLDGKVLAASDNVDVGKLVNRQPYFDNSLKASFTQPPYYAVNTGKLTIIQTEPILSEGKIVGVLAGQVNIATLGNIMTERSGFGDTGETYLVSNENNYFLTPSRFDGYSQTQAYHSEGIDKAVAGQTGSGTYKDYRGVTVLGYYRWIPELQTGLLAEQDEAEALAASQSARNTGILIAFLATVMAVAVGFILITRISNPLQALTHIATQIAGGNLKLRAEIKRRNEIGVLGEAFNKMTAQLSQNIAQLDQRLEELDRTNKDLQVASAKAREAARVKSEFMATMSHELRTPLNAMLGFSGILLEGMGGEIDEDANHMVSRIHSNSERLLGLINSILDIAKIEAGRLEIVNRPVEMRHLVETWRGQMGVLAQQKGLTFNVTIDPALPQMVNTDAERLSQITINLLSNAFKFTEKGNVTLSVKPVSDQLQIDVTDTGIGIPPHALNYIFEEFRQLDGSSQRAYGGTGLGLAIVRNLCRMMDGSVRVRSDLGKGSTFTVTVPLQPVFEITTV